MNRVVKKVSITRLGEGVDRGFLQPQPMARTLAAVKEYAEDAERYGVIPRAFATSAVRDAENRGEFCGMVKEGAGIDIEVIDGDKEAELDFIGASALFPKDESKLVLDIGGGSTEFIKGMQNISDKFSLNMGSVRFTERFISAGNLAGLCEEVEDMLKPHIKDIISAKRIVGIGGTITSLASVDIGLEEYDESMVQGYFLPATHINAMRRRFCSASPDEMKEIKGLQRGREDIILAGTAILEESLDMLKADGICVSDWDNLEGYLL